MIQSIEGKCQVSSLVFDVELFVKIFPVASHLSPLVYIIAELIFIPPSTRVCVCLYVRNQSILFTRTRPVAYEHTSQIKDNGNIGRRGKKEHGGYWRITKCPSSSSSSFWLRDVEAKVWCARADPSMRANHSFRWFFFYLVFFLLQEDVRTTSRQLKYSIGPQWNSR
jgi:hypothetical protein